MASLVRPVQITTTIRTAGNAVTAEAAWSSGTTYAADALVNRDLDGQGRAWKSLVNTNLNHDPATDDGTHWEDQGPTNPWLMHGDSATRQTTHADSLTETWALPATERVDTIWFGNLSGTSLRVVQTDAIDGVVFDETFSLVADSGIMDWYRWFFEPIERKDEYLVEVLGAYSGSTIDLTLAEAGATVGCGAIVPGFSKVLGGTRWDLSLGLKDYSTFAENAFGDEVVVERAYKKTASFTTVLDNGYVDELFGLLARYRATPVLIVADPGFTRSAVWGLATFKVDVPGPAASFCSLDVRSRAT
jgi:hypothetical protein